MPRGSVESGGPSYYRLYRAAERRPTEDEFASVCEASDLPPPTTRMFNHLRRLFDARKPNYMPMNALDMELKGRRSERWSAQRVEQLVATKRRERPELEFKSTLDAKDKDNQTKRPWAAMANSGGGSVVYGVEEAATVASGLRPLRLAGVEERIHQENARIDPPTNQTVHILEAEDGHGYVVVVIRPAVPGVIHLVDGRAPKRVGTTTDYMSSEEIRRWIMQGERPPLRPS
jgi:hypothetical protein